MPGDAAVRGHLELLLLAALAKGDAHGYVLIERLREQSEGSLVLAEGSVYPLLHQLEDRGSVTSSWEYRDGRKRRVYSLTRPGRTRLAEKRRDWTEFVQTIDFVLGPA
jgi:DNA-binding PadR family transcriptional regulator